MFEKELIKLLVEHDVKLETWIKDEKLDEVHMTTAAMYRSGELALDYTKENCRLRVVKGNEIEAMNVDEFRKYFLKAYSGEAGYASSRDIVEKLLQEYLASHPTHTFDLICTAAKSYVDHCKSNGEYMMKCHNFIINDKGVSTLEAVVDDLGEKVKDNYYDLI